VLVDHFGEPQDWCTHCRPSAHLPAIPGRPDPLASDTVRRRPHIQLKLFEPQDDPGRPPTHEHAFGDTSHLKEDSYSTAPTPDTDTSESA
jgi:hypothetical protein